MSLLAVELLSSLLSYHITVIIFIAGEDRIRRNAVQWYCHQCNKMHYFFTISFIILVIIIIIALFKMCNIEGFKGIGNLSVLLLLMYIAAPA